MGLSPPNKAFAAERKKPRPLKSSVGHIGLPPVWSSNYIKHCFGRGRQALYKERKGSQTFCRKRSKKL
jgi:hypothetical protein